MHTELLDDDLRIEMPEGDRPHEIPEGDRPQELPDDEDDALERELEPRSPEIGQPFPRPDADEPDPAGA